MGPTYSACNQRRTNYAAMVVMVAHPKTATGPSWGAPAVYHCLNHLIPGVVLPLPYYYYHLHLGVAIMGTCSRLWLRMAEGRPPPPPPGVGFNIRWTAQ